MAEQIEIVPYNPAWAGLFEQERELLGHYLQHLAPVVEHIGSTAVKGLGARPVIDIMVGLREESHLAEVVEPMLAAGYCYYPCYEALMPGRRLFARLQALGQAVFQAPAHIPSRRQHPSTHHLHVVPIGSPYWQRHIAFRDYLRSHPLARDAFFRMKVKLARGKWEGAADYEQAKAAFIRRIEWLMGLEAQNKPDIPDQHNT